MRNFIRIKVFYGCLLSIWFLLPISGSAQKQLPESHKIKKIESLAIDFQNQNRIKKKLALAWANQNGIQIRQILPDGRVAEIQEIINDYPIYYITCNLTAAKTISTDKIWSDEINNLNLTGSGMIIGEWDEGGVLNTHQEFGDRIFQVDDPLIMSEHATNIAGTIIASGKDNKAHGMSFRANLKSHDWNDDKSEMTMGIASGISISNHSYSIVAGWEWNWFGDSRWAWFGDPSLNQSTDWKFGFYSNQSSDWDQIARIGPNYLIVTAAGNDRSDIGPEDGEQYWIFDGSSWVLDDRVRDIDGEYDCIPGGAGVAKNVLTVGAVHDISDGYHSVTDVKMSHFSSWGPTDDGRIKPDIVANGISLYSTSSQNDHAYKYNSGTSFASASVAGSLALLQQHYQNTHKGLRIRSETLKALVIHTADESGNTPGPDFQYGWGLLNASKAAHLISYDQLNENTIQELILFENKPITMTIQSNGKEPVCLTISWSDVPGLPADYQLNPNDRMLVNDIDLRITRDNDNKIYYPWILDKESPDLGAATGDNNVDNVEQIIIKNPHPGTYKVTFTHKNTLKNGRQYFALITSDVSFVHYPPEGIFVWEGESNGPDYSGTFIYDALIDKGFDVTYTTDFPNDINQYKAVFLSFGNYGLNGDSYTSFTDRMAVIIENYLKNGGKVYIEGGDSFGSNQRGNLNLLSLFGLSTVNDGRSNTIDGLEGQDLSIARGIHFSSSSQLYNEWIDEYQPSSGINAFVEQDYGCVAVQNEGIFGQKTFCLSYALAPLIDDDLPSTRNYLLNAILHYFELEIENAPHFNDYVLYNNYPNPFNQLTTINYQIPEASNVRIIIYDILGKRIKTFVQDQQIGGDYQIQWDGTDENGISVSTGVYFYSFQAGNFTKVGKMLLMQ